MIEARDLSKHYGDKLAVDHLGFTVEPGQVTDFLGPNGAGKSTTMRLILGLDRPDTGSATIAGKPYRELTEPLRTVGAMLEGKAVHTGGTAYNHLLVLAQPQRLPRRRVDQVIDLVGLHPVAGNRAGGFWLGIGQRLGIAVAMLGDPEVLVRMSRSSALVRPEVRSVVARCASEEVAQAGCEGVLDGLGDGGVDLLGEFVRVVEVGEQRA
jgi:ABC-2 type transport system ATP-binding protein